MWVMWWMWRTLAEVSIRSRGTTTETWSTNTTSYCCFLLQPTGFISLCAFENG